MFRKAFFCILFLSAVSVFAEGPCAKDRETFCQAAAADREKMWICMEANSDKLSPLCKERRELFKGNMVKLGQACEVDANKYCAEIKPGKGRRLDCLDKHKTQISKKCFTQIEIIKKERKEGLKEIKAAQKAGRLESKADARAAMADKAATAKEVKAGITETDKPVPKAPAKMETKPEVKPETAPAEKAP